MTLSPSTLGDRSLKHDVNAEIVDMLLRGELKPGDRIGETLIANRLGISRSPVREAFSQLAHEGLIVRKPRSGNFIANVTADDVADILAIRSLLESHAARLASVRMTSTDVAGLRGLIVEMERTALAGDLIEAVNLNTRFHQSVLRIAGNAVLERLWRSLDPLVWLLAPAATRRLPEGFAIRHAALIDALLAGDAEVAAQAFHDHIQAFARSVADAGDPGSGSGAGLRADAIARSGDPARLSPR